MNKTYYLKVIIDDGTEIPILDKDPQPLEIVKELATQVAQTGSGKRDSEVDDNTTFTIYPAHRIKEIKLVPKVLLSI
jgi:hypothetical protein